MHWHRQEALRALARAVAFANIDLEAHAERWVDHRHYEGNTVTRLRVFDHPLFMEEWARALRVQRGRPRYDISAQDFPRDLLPEEDPTDRQFHMQSLLTNVMTSDAQAVSKALRGLSVALFPLAVKAEGKDWKATRKFRHRMQLEISYLTPFGYDGLRYAVALAGMEKLYHRLARCRACNRYILAKTDRRVRYCAESECQPQTAAKAMRKPRSREAAYKREQRRRRQWWDTYRATLHREMNGAATAASLEALIRRGRSLLPKCFPRTSAPRAAAERLLTQAEGRLQAMTGAGVSSRGPAASRR